jgi:hypothetical protein
VTQKRLKGVTRKTSRQHSHKVTAYKNQLSEKRQRLNTHCMALTWVSIVVCLDY